jgi:lactate dehydrogenase-like 2-hydroxyacid dehydrogenase
MDDSSPTLGDHHPDAISGAVENPQPGCEDHDAEEVSIMTTAIIGTGGIGSAIARQLAAGGEALQLSSADKVTGSGMEFSDRGDHELKGVPGSWRLYAVAG